MTIVISQVVILLSIESGFRKRELQKRRSIKKTVILKHKEYEKDNHIIGFCNAYHAGL